MATATPTPTPAPTAEAVSQSVMHIRVYSPFQVYFNDNASSISGENTTGPFDILPRHHNFMTLLQPCELIVRKTDGSEQRIRITSGIMHVKANQVVVFLDV